MQQLPGPATTTLFFLAFVCLTLLRQSRYADIEMLSICLALMWERSLCVAYVCVPVHACVNNTITRLVGLCPGRPLWSRILHLHQVLLPHCSHCPVLTHMDSSHCNTHTHTHICLPGVSAKANVTEEGRERGEDVCAGRRAQMRFIQTEEKRAEQRKHQSQQPQAGKYSS